MKKSPYKQADSRQIYREQKTGGMQKMLDPAGVFAPDQVKSIMTEGDKSAFKMKGFPQHAGVSPMKQEIEYPNMLPEVVVGELPSIPRKSTKGAPLEEPTAEETFAESKYGKYQKKSLTVPSKDKKKKVSEKIKKSFKDFISEYSPSKPGYKGEIGKAVIEMSAKKLLTKKEKKKPVGILSEKWNKIM